MISSLKMASSLVKTVGKWERVNVDPSHCSHSQNNDLISIEVLSNYTIISNDNRKQRVKDKKDVSIYNFLYYRSISRLFLNVLSY